MADLFNGTDFNVFVGPQFELPIARATSCEISLSSSLRDATTKDSGGDAERLPGLREWSISCDALFSVDYAVNKSGLLQLFNAQKNRTLLKIRFKSSEAGTTEYTGSVLVESISLNAGMEENMGYSVSFAGVGVLSASAVPDVLGSIVNNTIYTGGGALVDTTITINLTGANRFKAFSPQDISYWFINLPTGLTATSNDVAEGAQTLGVNIDGIVIPAISDDRPIAVVIPGEFIDGEKTVIVPISSSVKFSAENPV